MRGSGQMVWLVLGMMACATPAERELSMSLDRAHASRRSGEREEALVAVADALARARPMVLQGRLRARLDNEVVESVRTLERTLLERQTTPLDLEQRIARVRSVLSLPELTPTRRRIEAELARQAKKICDQLTHIETPHARTLARRYCRHFSLPIPAPLPLPEVRSSLELAVGLRSVTVERAKTLAHRLEDAFAASPWHDTDARTPAPGALSGFGRARFDQRKVAIDAPWMEQIPYQATETYQQSYTETESYSAQVSYTTYQSYTYSCGTYQHPSTCTGSRPQTQYRTEMRTRPVTRYRTATRTVTRYRQEPRVFHYEAVRHGGLYECDLTVQVRLDDASVPIHVAENEALQGFLHDVSFPPAKIAPSRPNLPSGEAWFEKRADRLERELISTLNLAWRQRYCSAPQYTFEEAARCLRGLEDATPVVTRALAGVLGADAELLHKLAKD